MSLGSAASVGVMSYDRQLSVMFEAGVSKLYSTTSPPDSAPPRYSVSAHVGYRSSAHTVAQHAGSRIDKSNTVFIFPFYAPFTTHRSLNTKSGSKALPEVARSNETSKLLPFFFLEGSDMLLQPVFFFCTTLQPALLKGVVLCYVGLLLLFFLCMVLYTYIILSFPFGSPSFTPSSFPLIALLLKLV
ncbi:unnamed protein product [Trypanosoma congolense IL3000]|uniref:WGS project CAEQ00000000 data, annotated contig 1717 n=1 Tax=Trypanosoma congolense (strain IL3000) TaxID=1068625 RepID=F9W885_TRYCI|nr:unnamed protein product [Trypanosoma congolense IL3000]